MTKKTQYIYTWSSNNTSSQELFKPEMYSTPKIEIASGDLINNPSFITHQYPLSIDHNYLTSQSSGAYIYSTSPTIYPDPSLYTEGVERVIKEIKKGIDYQTIRETLLIGQCFSITSKIPPNLFSIRMGTKEVSDIVFKIFIKEILRLEKNIFSNQKTKHIEITFFKHKSDKDTDPIGVISFYNTNNTVSIVEKEKTFYSLYELIYQLQEIKKEIEKRVW